MSSRGPDASGCLPGPFGQPQVEVLFAAVLSGVTTGEDFEKYEVYRVLDGLSNLPDLVTR